MQTNRMKRLSEETTHTDTETDVKRVKNGNIEVEMTDIKFLKQLMEIFLSSVGKGQHNADESVDMKHLTAVVKDMKMILLTESEQYNCVGVVYRKVISNSKREATDNAVLEPDKIKCNESSRKLSHHHHPTCKCICGCNCFQECQDQKMNKYDPPSEPKKRKWQSIFGLFGK